MDPNQNRNAMGSRAGGTALKFGAQGGPGTVGTRQGTAGKGLGPIGGGVGSSIEVKERPLTVGGGINGPQTATKQSDRMVYDKNYYVTITRKKLMSIQEETEKLKTKAQQINKEQTLYNKLEARVEDLNNEVRSLEGQLADYNLALDKLRVNTRPEDVKNAFHHVKSQNEKLKNELDDIFIERKKIEEQTESIQSELTKIHQQMELRLNELDPYQRSEYQKLMNENNELMSEYKFKQEAMEELLNRLAGAENRLRMDSQKLKGQLLKEQITDLETKKTDYEIQLNEANLSIPEARNRILDRMKEDNNSISNMEKRVKEVKKNIDIYEKKLRELEVVLEDKKTEEEDKKNYEYLYQKDQEMDEFLNSFERIRSNEINELSKIEEKIVDTLERTAKVLEISNQLPTRDATIHRGDRSQNTLAQTRAQYEIRLNSLRALENTDKRTTEEVENLKSNIAKMKEETTQKFDKIEEFSAKLNQRKAELQKREQSLIQLKEKIAPLISNSDYETNIADKKYQMHDQYSGYSNAERKLQELQSQKYYLQHYIITKSKDVSYEDCRNECMSYAEELNKKLLSAN